MIWSALSVSFVWSDLTVRACWLCVVDSPINFCYTWIRRSIGWLARWYVFGSFAIFHGFGHLAVSDGLPEHFLLGAAGDDVWLCRGLLLVVSASRWLLWGRHVDILGGYLRRLGMRWRWSVCSLPVVSSISGLSSLVALDAQTKHHDHP